MQQAGLLTVRMLLRKQISDCAEWLILSMIGLSQRMPLRVPDQGAKEFQPHILL